jgi:ABC-type transporter Mla subunit MlaD
VLHKGNLIAHGTAAEAGIVTGAKVQVAGMDAGEVLVMAVPNSPPAKFRVKLRINEKFSGLVRTDSVVTVGTEGVVGNRFLEISAGSSHAPAVATVVSLVHRSTNLSRVIVVALAGAMLGPASLAGVPHGEVEEGGI